MSVIFEHYVGSPGVSANVRGFLGATVATDGQNLSLVRGLLGSVHTGLRGVEHFSARGLIGRIEAFDGSALGFARGLLGKASASIYAAPPTVSGFVQGMLGTCRSEAREVVDISVRGLLGRVLATDGRNLSIVRGLLGNVIANDVDPFAGARLLALQTAGFAALQTGAPMQALRDTVDFGESHSAQSVLALLDVLAFGGSVADIVSIPVAIAVSIAFGDSLLGGVGGALDDEIEFSDENVALALHIASLIDGFTLDAETSSSAVLFGFLSDSFAFGDAVDVKEQILAAIADGIEFGMVLYTGEDTYTAWVMTPETRAMRSYSNFPFNSYAVFGGRLIGAKHDGVFVLEGDTDNGQAIRASVRTGMLDFSTRQMKRMDRAYLGYTADGALSLRVATTSPEGKKVEFVYRMAQPIAAEAPRETRIKTGKGLRSVYWQFALDNNLDGGRFEVHDFAVLPIMLSRKVR